MHLAANVIDIWAFQNRPEGVRYFLLYTSDEKAERYFNGGRFWQIPSGCVNEGEGILESISRVLGIFGLSAQRIWAGEHAYLIYNRRFVEMQAISVYAAEVSGDEIRLDPAEHSKHEWLSFEACAPSS